MIKGKVLISCNVRKNRVNNDKEINANQAENIELHVMKVPTEDQVLPSCTPKLEFTVDVAQTEDLPHFTVPQESQQQRHEQSENITATTFP